MKIDGNKVMKSIVQMYNHLTNKLLVSQNYYLLLLFILPFSAQSQTITVSEYLSMRNDVSYELLGTMRGHTLVFRNQNSIFQVQAFDDKMRKSWSKELTLDKRRPEVVGIIPRAKDFNIFYRHKLKTEVRLKVHKYDAAANLVDSVTIKNYGSTFYSPRLEAMRSDDRSKVIIYEIANQSHLRALSYDLNTMKILWEDELKLDVTAWGRNLREMTVDNQGRMYIIFEENNRKSQLDEHFLSIFRLDGSGAKKRYQIDMPEHLTYDISFAFDNKNDQLVAGGLFADENFGRADGYIYMRFDPNKPEERLLEYELFDDEFVLTFLEKIDKENAKNKGIIETDIQEIVLRSDGGILLIGERNREYNRNGGDVAYGSVYSRGPVVDYYYDDLFIISINPDGKTHWKNVLHKKQYSQDDDAMYSSYFLAKTSRALRLLYNDEIQYENTVSEYVINATGEFDRNAVMSTESQRLRLRFRDAMQVSANELIVPSESRNRLKLVRVRY